MFRLISVVFRDEDAPREEPLDEFQRTVLRAVTFVVIVLVLGGLADLLGLI